MGFGMVFGGAAKGAQAGITLGQQGRQLDLESRALDIKEKQDGNEILNQLRTQANATIGRGLQFLNKAIEGAQASNNSPEAIAGAIEGPLAELEGLAASVGIDFSPVRSAIATRLQMPPPATNRAALIESSDVETPYDKLTPKQRAAGIAGGRFVRGTNPQSGASEVMDLATGALVSTEPPIGTEVDPFFNTERPPASELATPDMSEGVGPLGAIKNYSNTITDFFTGEAWAPNALEAETALNSLATRTSIALQETVPGKPNVTTLKMFEELAARPNKFTQGEARTKSRLSEMRGRIQQEIDRIQTVVLNRPREWKPTELQAAKKSQSQLRLFLEEYTAILDAWGGKKKDRPPLGSFGKGKK